MDTVQDDYKSMNCPIVNQTLYDALLKLFVKIHQKLDSSSLFGLNSFSIK